MYWREVFFHLELKIVDGFYHLKKFRFEYVNLVTFRLAYPALLGVLGIAGGLYLSWLGYKGWRAALTGSASEIGPSQGNGFWRDTAYGFTVTATNPKVALLWGSLSTFVGGATTSLSLLLLFATMSSLILFVIYGGYGLLFSVGHIRRLYDRFRRVSKAVFGTIFGVIGFGMILR